MRRARIPAVALAAALAAIAAGCSKSEPEQAPVACLEGPDVYLEALQRVPGKVRLQGETPISDCLVPGQEGGELAEIGLTMITVATRLNEKARRDPSGRATLELGYLVGAAREASRQTAGIHTDLMRRLDAAALFGNLPPREGLLYQRRFQQGQVAGQTQG